MQQDLNAMAEEVAQLMAQRFGGARRGAKPDLATMLRRRGGALPRKHRRAARILARAQSGAATPLMARQVDPAPAVRAHAQLIGYLRPLGSGARWRSRALDIAAAVMLGVLVVGAVAVWMMVRRGMV